MTRNLYLGAHITRPLVEIGLPPEQQGPAFVAANTTLRAIVDQTNFPLRAKQLAREIRQHRPGLIGLQEVALWRHGPLDGTPATVVDYDFLQSLTGELAALGQHYEVADVQQESDVSGPAFLGGSLQNVRLTRRDVVLKRAHDGVHVTSARGANHAARIPLTIAGQSLSFIRGYDVRAGGQRLRFVNTESQSSDVAGGAERRAGDRRVRLQLRPPLVRGRPERHGARLCALRGDRRGRLHGRVAALRARLGRRADGSPMPVEHAWVVGKDPNERTPPTPIGRLWPSDHAGVVVRQRP